MRISDWSSDVCSSDLGPSALLAKPQLRDKTGITRRIFTLEIIKQAAAIVDHHQKTTTRMIVLRMSLEMIGQVLDALGQDRDLDFRRSEERRVGKGGVSSCRSRWSPVH